MSNKNHSSRKYSLDTSTEITEVQNSYGTDSFGFFWLKLSGFGMMLYYIAEMINRVLFVSLDENIFDLWSAQDIWRIWRIVDSAFLAFMFIPIGIQVLSWKRNNLGIDSKKKTNLIAFSVIGAGIFVAMYEILTELREELDYSHQGDLTVPFLFMMILHVYGFFLLKNLINMIGRYKGVTTGTGIFYILFAANPVVRYLLPFVLLIFFQLGGDWASVFFIYSELAMTYISAVIAVGFFIYVIIDSNKISVGHLMMNHDKKSKSTGLPEIQGIKLIEFQNKVIEVPIKRDVSVFCPKCGLVVYDDAQKCKSCGASIS